MFNKLISQFDGKYISRKVGFIPIGVIPVEVSKKCFDFAYNMTFGKVGEHREYRSGGQHFRKLGEIFANTYLGKLAEFAVYLNLRNHFNIDEPDVSEWGKGEWDDADLIINEKKISIKSMKFFSNLILLEKKDWDVYGGYIPNQGEVYDIHVVVRIKNDPETIMKNHRLLYLDNNIGFDDLWEKFENVSIEYDIPGFLRSNELQQLIHDGFVIKQGDKLNGSVDMDADNYYCQLGDINRSLDELIALF